MNNQAGHLRPMDSRHSLPIGKLSLLLTIVTVALLAQGCTKILDDDLGGGADIGSGIVTPPAVPAGPMAADVRVISDPQGGTYVSELSCVFEASEIPGGGSKPIIITVNWVAPCGTHKSEVFVFDGGKQTYESSYSESGRAIALTFWTTISWTDAQGKHQIQSGTAACS
ncbi:hypothetical protein KKG90_09980 [Candidatus Bipolaricaulota bacterium]|nr:hypothetical protein [Candidatus Bipolaricaulota bacterium]